MIWEYLAEFWNSITEVVVSGGTYTIDWFKSIGNAVAGAIGGMFEPLIHHIYDFFYLAEYILANLQTFFSNVFKPLSWVFNFLKGFFDGVGSSPPETAISWVFPTEVLAVFQAVPYWNVFMWSIGAGISILIIVFIFKRFTQF